VKRKLGPYSEVTVIDITRLDGEVHIFAVPGVPLAPCIRGAWFSPWRVKVRTPRDRDDRTLVMDNGATPPYGRPGGCARIETDEGTIKKIKDGRVSIPEMAVAQPRESVVEPGLPFRRRSGGDAATIVVDMFVAPGTRVRY